MKDATWLKLHLPAAGVQNVRLHSSYLYMYIHVKVEGKGGVSPKIMGGDD